MTLPSVLSLIIIHKGYGVWKGIQRDVSYIRVRWGPGLLVTVVKTVTSKRKRP